MAPDCSNIPLANGTRRMSKIITYYDKKTCKWCVNLHFSDGGFCTLYKAPNEKTAKKYLAGFNEWIRVLINKGLYKYLSDCLGLYTQDDFNKDVNSGEVFTSWTFYYDETRPTECIKNTDTEKPDKQKPDLY
jgi:hypothetical protein